ncbi:MULTISPECIES: ubiquitin family protein [Halobacteriales]|jgi:hypothetical protein|uniref:ubiquitin family protein n=1 Tax=Halobacteriales TaxID=2235 RepID=UPI0021C574BF|nr:ubiquitin family protein [Halomicroarcula laminariae]
MPPQLTITIEAPNGKSDEFSFDQSTKVSESAEKAADEFGIQNTNNPTLARITDEGQEELKPNRTLVSYDLDGETVIWTDRGKGAGR